MTNTSKIAIVFWIGFLGMLYWFWNSWEQNENNPNQIVVVDDNQEIILKRNRYGHYLANGKINGQEVVFFVDTGASKIAIPEPVANKLGLKKGVRVLVQTANGVAEAYSTLLEKVQLGNITINNLSGFIQPNMDGNEILLGMNFLGKLSFSHSGEELRISSDTTNIKN